MISGSRFVPLALLFLASCSGLADEATPTGAVTERYAGYDLSGRILDSGDDAEGDIVITLEETEGIGYHVNFVRLTCNNRSSQEWGASSFIAELGSNHIEGGTTLVFQRHYRCTGSARPQEILADLTDDFGHRYRATAAPFHPAWPGG
jgi:hypothetical protein